ncbi:SusC/RagA family TonB-linked outer membrane protein [Dysgonomonas sp. Marseille-P4677]|uniref:SusC/RagA family TonB-linked outer membrane protein n=1 Tax=Dysgonomonas sp. Marseille-P4677 TaxID=2364790 RepID=UPI0019149A7A|nr:SusC/RagA family TonB-linked outer membrane protein [Dysgonomonas sp. Marseille-P4677]MBK5722350.1 SusC/RagA family TonB-linked outer membrane protein [Dysgonomonas sp. Marseille-P4677]
MRTVIKWHLHLPSFYWICIACLLLPIYSSANNSTKENLSNKKAIELSETLLQDSIQVTGHIVDKLGEPLIGVTVLNENTKRGSMTDLDGNYKIIAKTGDNLIFRYIGMKTVEVTLRQGQSNINMTLEDDENVLEDVVVTGYQTISKERATGSYAILTSKSLENKTDVNLISRIEGLVPGINTKGTNGYDKAIIRGRSTVEGNSNVLYVVDGIPYEGNTDIYLGETTNPLKYINPNDVANITVLKDAAAASIYGARAANGVIVITTHRGRVGKTKVSYNGTVRFSEAPSLSSLNLTNSSELVDYFQTAYNSVTPGNKVIKDKYNTWNERIFRDPVFDALVAYDSGSIDKNELDKSLAYYSSLDNRNQIYDEFSRTAITHQHTLSVSGGNDKYKFYLSGNFINNNEHDKYSSSKQYAINSKNDFNISSKLSAHLNLTTNINSSDQSNYNTDSYASLLQKYPSYYMLKDENGNLLNLPNGRGEVYKSNFELDKLIDAGLYNEYYYPTQDMNSNLRSVKTNYIRIQGGFNWKIIDGLSASATYQTEIVNSKKKEHFLEESYYMRSNINDAAQINQGVITYNVPIGGRLNERRSDQQSYTLRGQLNFNKTLGKDHTITALGGAERRENNSTSSEKTLLGYDENGMRYITQDKISQLGKTINSTQSISNNYVDNTIFKLYVGDGLARYVSFYGNASYSYRQRYDISVSARLDESSLFGRKAENKWKPIWSSGASWHISKEDFMKDIDWINYLKLRLTYGIGGNSPSNSTGIFAKVSSVEKDTYTNLYPLAYIKEPKNEKLTWEKTATTNIGIDFSLFDSRLGGSFDYYQKRSTDLLGDKAADPTLGWSLIRLNYGAMNNKGVEIALNGLIIKTREFSWNTTLTYTYNKNKLKDFRGAQTRDAFLYNDVLQLEKPISSVYSARYAGLNEKGEPLFYNQNDEKVSFDKITKDDLVYSGTRIPKYTSALMNTFSYKNLELSFKLMYYGGHVIRDQSLKWLTGEETVNFNRESLNFWKKPGDELNSDGEPNLNIGPALNSDATRSSWILGWQSRDTNIKKAHYIKLRNINLVYRIPKSILNKMNIEQLALSFQADDLVSWTSNGKIDPETTSQDKEYYYVYMRPMPAFSFGININF